MISFSSDALVLFALVAGAASAGEMPAVDRCPSTSRFEMVANSPEMAPEVCISADEATTFFFDSRVAVGAVEFEPEGRLADWSQGKEGRSVNLIPSENYLGGERIRMTVRFADGILPATASFWLVGHVERGTRRVEVNRQPRPADAFRREAADAQAEARQCREEKAQLVSERSEPGGLMGDVYLRQVGTVAMANIYHPTTRPGNALRFVSGKAYNYTREGAPQVVSLSVWLRLLNAGDEPWTTGGAALLDSSGEQVSLAAFQPAPILTSSEGNIVLGTEREPGQLTCPCAVKLWDAPGKRVVTLGNIVFPDGPKPKR